MDNLRDDTEFIHDFTDLVADSATNFGTTYTALPLLCTGLLTLDKNL